MDSIEAKTQQFKTSLQSLYVDAGIENLYKSVLDIGNNIVKTFTGIAQTMNTPIAAIAKFGAQFVSLANLVTTVFGLIKARVSAQQAALNGQERRGSQERVSIAQQELAQKEVIFLQEQIAREKANQGSTRRERRESQERIRIAEEELAKKQELANTPVGTSTKGGRGGVTKTAARVGMVANLVGSATSLFAANMGESTQTQRTGKAWLTELGSVAQGIGIGSMFGTTGMVVGAGIGALAGAIEAVGIATESTEEKIKNLNNTIEETSNKKLQSKDELKTLIDYQNKYQELSKVRNQDAESRKEWINLNNEIAANYPELIKSMNMEGNYVVDMTNAYRQLAEAKFSAYKNDFLSNMSAELGGLNDLSYILSNVYNLDPIKSLNKINIGPNKDKTQEKIEKLIQGQSITDLSLSEITSLFGSDYMTIEPEEGYSHLATEYDNDVFKQIFERFNELAQENYTLADAQKQISNEFSEQYETAIDNFNSSVYELLLAGNDALTFQSDLIQNKINSGNQEWLNVITGLYDLEPSSIQNALALQELNEEWDKYYKSDKNQQRLHTEQIQDKETGEWREFTEGDLYNEFIQQYQGVWLNKFLNDTQQFEDEALNSLYEQSGKYNKLDYSSLLRENNVDENNLTKLLELYDEQYQQAINNFQESIMNNFDVDTSEYDSGLVLSYTIPPDFLDSITSKIQAILNNSTLSDDTKTNQYNGIVNVINAIGSLSDESQKLAAFGALDVADLTSLTGIYKFIEDLKTADVDLDQTGLVNAITNFGETLSINIATEFDNYTQSIISRTEEFGKALSSASKGLDIKAASELANKLNIDLQDFSFRDGKFFLDDVNKLQEASIKFNEDLENGLTSRIQDVTSLLNQYNIADIFNTANTYLKNGQATSGTIEESIQMALEKLNYVPDLDEIDRLANAYRSYYDQAIAAGTDIETYIEQQLQSGTQELEIIKEAVNYSTNVALIESGNLEAFLNNLGYTRENYADFDTIINSMQSGMFSNLPDNITPYIQALWKTYQNINKSLYDTALKTIDGRKELVTVTPQNKEFLRKYGKDDAGQLVGDNIEELEAVYLDFANESLESIRNDITNALQNGELTQDEASSLLKTLHDEEYKNNMYDALSGVADTYDNISYEAAQALATALGFDSVESSGLFSFDSAGKISTTYDELRQNLDDSLFKGLINDAQYNEIRAKLEEQKSKLDTDNIINNIIGKRDQITAEGVSQLATALDTNYNNILNMLQPNDDGTYTMSIATLWNNFKDKMNDATRQYVAGQIDNVISSITGLSGSQSKGFTNLAEMQKYVSELNKLGVTTTDGAALDFRTLFEYDNTLHAYRLSTQGLIAQIGGMQSQLAELTGEEKEIAEQLIADTTRQFAEQIDADSVIDAMGTNQISLARTNFRKAVEDYNSVLIAMAEAGESVELLDAEALLNNLHAGGLQAVEAMTEIARIQGQKITADQAESAYRSKVSQYIDAIDQLVAKPGEIVDQTTADIISAAGGQVAQLGSSGSYLVQSAANLYLAYKDLLEKMRGTGEATLADLNKVAGAMLDNKDGEQQVIDALSDAAGLTYSRFGEILTTAGYQLTEELVQQLESSGVIQSLGGSKMRITDFKAFADLMNWDADSQEYVSAFKAYNDSLIEMNRQTEKNILEEASKLKDLQGGDWLNLTQLSDVLNKQIETVTQQGTNAPETTTALDTLNDALISYGGYLENGILKTVEGADIPSIIKLITDNIQQYGALSEAELAQLADMLKEILKSYADAISSGIKGTLSGENAQKLSQWAKNVGIGELNFSETAEGLKLSTEQAYELYHAISQIDALQGRLLFKDLQESLNNAKGGDFYGATAALAAPKRVQQEINAVIKEQAQIYEKIAGNRATESDQKRLAVLERQKANLESQKKLYSQLSTEMAYANMDNPDSYNFMDNKLPDTFQGPINYWNSIGKAYTAMNEAGQTGKMEIQDFYNIVNEMSNLAALSGDSISFMGQEINGDLTSASKLIQAGFSSLSNVDGKGVKIDMGKLAANLQTGAKDMGKGFDAAIRDMARSQIDMITAMIRVLETVQAMEQLGQVDVDSNGILSVGEIFEDDGSFTEMYDQVRDFLLNSETLQPMLEDLKVNGIKLKDLLSEDQTAWREAGVSQQQYAAIMTAFYKAAISDNYDLDNLISSVLDVLSGTGQVFSYYDKETGVETVIDMNGKTYKINWNDEKDKKNIYDAFEKSGYWKTHDKPGDTEKLDETIREVLDKGHQGTLTGEALVAYDLAYNIITEYTTGEGESAVTTYKDSKDNEYPTPQEAVVGNILATQKAEQVSKIQEIEVDGQTFKTGTFRVKGGMEYKVEVDTETGETTYTTTTADGSHVSGKTREEMIHNLLERESRIESHGAIGVDDRSEEWIIENRRKLLIDAIPEVEFKNGEGKIFNPADDPDFQQKLTSFVNQSHEQIQKALESNMTKNKDDTYTFTLFDGNTITVKAENEEEALAKAEEQAKATANSMISVISAAIKSAFTEDNSIGKAIGDEIKEALASDDTPVTDSTTQGETKTVKIPKLSVEVDTMEITSVTNFDFPKGDNAVANTSDVTIPKMSATIDTLTINKVNNEPTFSPTKEDESSNVTISSMTSTVDDLTVDEIKKSHYDSTLKLSDNIANGEANVTNMAVGATNFTATGSLLALQGMNFATTSTSLSNIASATGKIGKASFSNFDILSIRLSTIKEQVDTIWSTVQQFADKTFTVNMNTNTTTTTTSSGSSNKSSGGNSSGGGDSGLSKIFGGVASAIGSIFTSGKNSASVLSPVADALKNIGQRTASGTILKDVGSYLKTIGTSNASSKVRSLASAMNDINNVSTKVKNAADALSKIPESKSMSVNFNYSTSRSNAKGNIGGFAHVKGEATSLAKGRKTLVGELGPELVVTNGHYYVVGQNGAEFVDLAKDAIVFNHKQTKRLLEQGMIGSRGKPVTNEANAISFARGNIPLVGPARDKFPTQMVTEAGNPNNDQKPTKGAINPVTTKIIQEQISTVKPMPPSGKFELFSYAKGNVGSIPHSTISGPARAGTGSAIAALYQLLAMWQSLLNASAKDLGAMGGAGRGGGGSKGGGDKNDNAGFIKDLEIWYNLLRQIARLEKDITYEVSKQKVLLSDQVINGKEIYNSYKEEYNYLIESAEKNATLADIQQRMYINKKETVNDSLWGKLLHYDDHGLMQMNTDLVGYVNELTKNNNEYFKDGILRTKVTSYVRDENGAVVTNKKGKEKTTTRTITLDLNNLPTSTLDFFSILNATDKNGAAVYTAEEQVAMLKAFGFGDLIKYDEKGKKIDESSKDAAIKMVENFWNRYDAVVKDVDSSYDAFKDTQNQALEQQAKANELIQKIVDNQIEVEQTVYNAIVDREQALIDEIQDERDALSKSNEKFLQGLNDALTKEQNMYQQQDEKNELTKLQRQLNILQRSGGSASQIRSLQEQISSKQRDMYFNEQQRQIDAIQEASDKELERLDAQIDLMTETLEYEKEHGLLWNEVYSIMQGTPEQIMDFITTYSKEFMTKSATDQNKYKNELGDKIEIYTESRDAENAGKGILNNKKPENTQIEPKTPDEPTIVTEPEKDEETDDTINNKAKLIKELEYYTKPVTTRDQKRVDKYTQEVGTEYEVIGVSKEKTFKNFQGQKKYLLKVLMDGKERYMPYFPSYWEEGLLDRLIKNGIPRFAKGGLIDYTGLAWVDGSKAKPETVLNAKQTAQLKGLQDVNSLNRSLAQITAIWDNLQTEVMNRDYNNEQETIVIEKAEVNMNVSSIANDYDARRAGDMALAEMMKIARKTGKQGVKRR